MASWWMREEPLVKQPGGEERQTVVKRPRGRKWNHLYLEHEVDTSGFLLKKSTHRRVRQIWQRRFFQFRGPYLVYWDHLPGRSSELAASVVDLREIANVSLSLDGTELVLMSVREHGFRLKSCLEESSHAAATDLSNWKNAMIKRVEQFHRLDGEQEGAAPRPSDATLRAFIGRLEEFYAEKAPELLAQVPRIATRFEGRERPLFQHLVNKYGPLSRSSTADESEAADTGDGADRAQPKIAAAAAAAEATTNPILNESETSSGTGDIEMIPAADVESPAQWVSDLSVEVDHIEHLPMPPSSDAAELPKTFRAAFAVIGVKYWDPLNYTCFEYVYLRIVRAFFVLSSIAMVASGPTMAIALATDSDDEGAKVALNAEKVCGERFRYNCIATLIYYVPLSSYGIGSLAVLRFLYSKCDTEERILSTHRNRVSAELERAAYWTLALWVVTTAVHTAGTIDHDVGVTSADIGYFDGKIVIYLAVKNIVLCLTQVPLFIFAILFHAEAVRLRCVIEDFKEVLEHRPFHFSLVMHVYSEVTREFGDADHHFHTTMFVSSICLMITVRKVLPLSSFERAISCVLFIFDPRLTVPLGVLCLSGLLRSFHEPCTGN